jgi:hypothetical protein
MERNNSQTAIACLRVILLIWNVAGKIDSAAGRFIFL